MVRISYIKIRLKENTKVDELSRYHRLSLIKNKNIALIGVRKKFDI